MKTKRVLLGLITAVCFAQTAVSVPAYPYPKKVKQADGTYITIITRGDEHGHIEMTEDGHPLFFNVATNNYEFATLSTNGSIIGSGIIATDATKRTMVSNNFLKTQDVKGIWNAFSTIRRSNIAKVTSVKGNIRKASQPQRIRINDFPTTGNQHSLVILVEFSDCDFTTVGDDAHNFYDNMLNEEGFVCDKNGANGSARDFYIASSNGKFTPTFDVVGPVKLSKKYSYYGANSGRSDNYARIAQFVKEACTLADPLVDFSKYDANKDGFVDNIYFFYAGFGEADSNKSNTIWPHAYNYEDFDELYGTGHLTLDGVKINSYSCSNEVNGVYPTMPTGIGTFTHEFGHVLGLADHYDVEYNSATFDPGSFDCMASGSYNNNGNTPPVFSAYERGELGWLDYIELNSNADTLNILPDLKDSNKAYRISVEGTNGNEFYVLENRQQYGWDKYLPGHGMLMWHIDIDKDVWENNAVNTIASHQHVDLIEADNRRTESTRTGDPFPGTSNVTKWTMKSWANKALLTLDDIEEKNDSINILIGGLNMKLPTPEVSVVDTQDDYFTASWTVQPIAKNYHLNIYEVNGEEKKVVDEYKDVQLTDVNELTIKGLKPLTNYELQLSSSRGSYTSDTAIVKIQTTDIPFTKYRPENVTLSNATANSISASWDAVKDADNYIVTLNRHSLSPEKATKGYDFGGRKDGMPELWDSNASFVTLGGYYGEAGPALRLLNDNEYLLIAYPDTKISSISFWGRSRNSESGTLAIEIANKGVWTKVDSINLAEASTANTYNFTFDAADSVRLVHHKNVSTFFIDDVTVGCQSIIRTPVEGYDAVEAGNVQTFTFNGLDKGSTFGLFVYAKKGEEISSPSKEIVFALRDFPASINKVYSNEDALPTVVYNINGQQVDSKSLSKGLYIFKQGNKTNKVIVK